MPTVCELKIEAKNKGLKGYSKMNKSQLQALINGSRPPPRSNRPRTTPLRLPRNRDALYGTGRNPYD